MVINNMGNTAVAWFLLLLLVVVLVLAAVPWRRGREISDVQQQQVFESSGIFVVPDNVHSIQVQLLGGGAGGAAGQPLSSLAGGGGGAGAFLSDVISVTPGQVIDVTVGEGGLGGDDSSALGTDGGDTIVLDLIAGGGLAATTDTSLTLGGVGGTPSGYGANANVSVGGNGYNGDFTLAAFGGDGGTSSAGVGGSGGVLISPGVIVDAQPGLISGSGGGGAPGVGTDVNAGGAGANGRVVINFVG